ncbi:cysteine hydrolase family protein [Bdellovibrio bacteriovorus]|uniref:cysteine hydrolase family protein n=1 Tax=Bdellovibrio TaxID=958 RepID=UPI0035A84C28
MGRQTFPLSSDQLELLLAFGESTGLAALAENMGKDPSVISRGLQRIAEDYPVLVKVKGRWELTPLGFQVNASTKEAITSYKKLLAKVPQSTPDKKYLSDKSILIIINAQVGLLDATQPGRNNTDAEKNISKLLTYWRSQKRPVIHVKHVSESADSIFYKNSGSCEFLPSLQAVAGEVIVEKTKSSAFAETELETRLKQLEPENLVLVGFTANECIDATARDASSLGFESYVVGDATAMFDVRSPDGKLLKAERIHRLTLANINAFYAKVIHAADIVI